MNNDVKEVVDWLIGMEQSMSELYTEAANFFDEHDNKALAHLLKGLAADEYAHMRIMKQVEAVMEGTAASTVVTLDVETRQRISAGIRDSSLLVEGGRITEDAMLDSVIESEYSEWNDMFLYVLSLLKGMRDDYIRAASGIQQHKKKIERYVAERPHLRGKIEGIKSIKDLWHERILVVDDDDMISSLLRIVLEDEGLVATARDAAEALCLLEKGYYALIVSDVDMPGLSGIDFFKKASAAYPNIKDRFLFFTGHSDKGRISFFTENSLRYILKPANIGDIKKAAVAILSKAN